MHRIGLLWATGHINPAQEHLVSHVIRQKLIVGIEGDHDTISAPARPFSCSCPKAKRHELGLLYVYYLLKFHGARVHLPRAPMCSLERRRIRLPAKTP
jgi:hypothetical protein